MLNVEMWFPVVIYKKENLLSQEENDKLAEHSLEIKNTNLSGGDEWMGGTYNTHGTHNVSKDLIFSPLISLITSHVNDFAKMHNCNANYDSNYSWLNISDAGNFQEFHTHNGSIFSAVYYIAAPEGSGRIVFEDPKEPDMMPLKSVQDKNQLSYTRISYAPTQGMLIIFRSYLRHLVEIGTNETPRISIALNFK